MRDRISFWVPKEYRWLFSAIEEVRRKADEKGVRLSQADVILSCVIPVLKEYSGALSATKVKVSKCKRKRNVSCSKADAWIFETIDRLVAAKNDLELSTTFSYELVRLAKNGYMGSKLC